MARVAIVGAGISGLALAYRLSRLLPLAQITVLEQRARAGGIMWTEQREGFQIEVGPNGFLDSKPSTLALCRELGLGDQLLPASRAAGRNRYLFLDGRLRRLPSSLSSFLFSDLLSWRGKLDILLEAFRPPRIEHSDESIDAFVRRRAGPEAARVLGDALVTGIQAGDPTLLSVRASFPRWTALEEQYGSMLKGLVRTALKRRARAASSGEPHRATGGMWSLRDGLRLVIETLCAKLPDPPMLGVTVQRLEPAAGADVPSAWTLRGEGQDRWSADAVLLTCPAHQQAAILAGLDPELGERIASIAYSGVAVVALGYHAADVPVAVDGFGFIAPERTRRDLLGVQWCSSIFPERAPPGRVLLRAMCGGWNRPDVVGWDDERLLQAVRNELRLAMRIEAEPLFHHIVRWERAIPQYHLGHPERVTWIEERLARYPGLFLGGNAYHGIAVNDCTEQAQMLACKVERYVTSRGSQAVF